MEQDSLPFLLSMAIIIIIIKCCRVKFNYNMYCMRISCTSGLFKYF